MQFFFFSVPGFSFQGGLCKTQTDNLETSELGDINIKLLMPPQKNDMQNSYYQKKYTNKTYKIKNKTKGGYTFFLHPFWADSLLIEPVYLLTISITRLSEKQFKELISGSHILKMHRCIANNNKIILDLQIEEIKDRISGKQYTCIRRDINLENGDIIVAIAKILHYPNCLDKEKNINFIKNVFNSITEISPSL